MMTGFFADLCIEQTIGVPVFQSCSTISRRTVVKFPTENLNCLQYSQSASLSIRILSIDVQIGLLTFF